MAIKSALNEFALRRPVLVTVVMVLSTILFALAAALPTLWPDTFTFLPKAQVDTDPENMLPADEPVRLFHDAMKKEMSLYDMVVLGVVNEVDPDGVFNPESLRKIYELTEYAKNLRWEDPEHPGKKIGVIEADVIAPSTVDNIEQAGPGAIRFEWLMPSPPKTRKECLAVRDKAKRLPFMEGTLLSEDGKAICVYLPITSKNLSHRVYAALNEKIASFSGNERYFITGLPVAEDTFGVEMFQQMAVSAPLAMLVVFLLLLFFFRKLMLILAPMIVAIVSVITTMGLLVITGNTIHIMSSMIPIFIMPIAVLDAIHILSEFFDLYQETRDRKKTAARVMNTLFTPMLFTSLTTAVGFASLALTPIPPVQVFGLFVAFGVGAAWIWTILFIPAFITFIPAKSLDNFGMVPGREEETSTPLSRFLKWCGRLTFEHAKTVLAVVVLFVCVAFYGISRININDNPTKWFAKSHPIRIADKVLNSHFGGTYMAYLALETPKEAWAPGTYAQAAAAAMEKRGKKLEKEEEVDGASAVFGELAGELRRVAPETSSKKELLNRLAAFAKERAAKDVEDNSFAWDEARGFVDEERVKDHVFKQPAVLDYIAALQKDLLSTGVVGKSNSLTDIVKTVYRELLSGEEKDYRTPPSAKAVAQCMMQYQNSHRPQDLWHFVTPGFRKSVIWAQLRSGDNRDMSRVAAAVEDFMAENPPPLRLRIKWFGLTYINVVWQEKMVMGMLNAFLGSFLIVFLMMALVYRSILWGFLAMIPLTVTIAVIYGIIGLVGKDYDMPVAILSSLSLGLAVDYAIHFLSRSRELYAQHGTWAATHDAVFGEPARAIARNVIVVGVGFLPLLAAGLIPYRTVGTLIAAILFAAGVASILILPALIRVFEGRLFPAAVCSITGRCGACLVAAAAIVALAAINMHRFLKMGTDALTFVSLGAVLILAAGCCLLKRAGNGRGRAAGEENGSPRGPSGPARDP